MRLLEFGKEASLASVIEAIKSVPEDEVTLRLPPDTPWLKNPVNEKILRKSVQTFGKKINLEGHPEPTTEPIKTDEAKVVEETLPTIPLEVEKGPIGKDEAGFIVGGDVLEHEPKTAEPKKEEASPIPTAPIVQPGFGGRFGRLKLIFRRLLRRWPLSIAAALGLLLIGGAYIVLALPKADVKIVVAERPLEREATITASTTIDKIDPDTRKIPGVVKTASQSGTKKTSATGTKPVGTKAAGAATIYNKTISAKTFPAGTKISTGSAQSAFQFTVDSAVTVPAKTVDLGTGAETYGQANVSVTATQIGTEYNLGSGTIFSLVGTPDSDAYSRNSASFTGGSKRDVQVVAQTDLDKLLTDLTNELKDKAKADLTSQAGSEAQVNDQAIKVTVASKSYDHKVGEEAGDVTLTLSISATATVYNGQNLKELLIKTLEAAAPDGYEVSSDGIETSADLSNVEANGDLTFVGHIRANLIPKFDHDALVNNLAGKRPQAAEVYLKEIPSVVSYEVNIWPNLPDFFRSFPRDTKRIHIQVTVQ